MKVKEYFKQKLLISSLTYYLLLEKQLYIFLLNLNFDIRETCDDELLFVVQVHCVWAAAEAYSAPSIVLTSHSHDGLHVFDDFREAYAWLSHNTEVDDKVSFSPLILSPSMISIS